MRVIRTLSESGSVEDREEEKKKLEHKFRESDSKVDQVLTFCPSSLIGSKEVDCLPHASLSNLGSTS
jgi:hypothetical protein